jgi:hypothetical protein
MGIPIRSSSLLGRSGLFRCCGAIHTVVWLARQIRVSPRQVLSDVSFGNQQGEIRTLFGAIEQQVTTQKLSSNSRARPERGTRSPYCRPPTPRRSQTRSSIVMAYQKQPLGSRYCHTSTMPPPPRSVIRPPGVIPRHVELVCYQKTQHADALHRTISPKSEEFANFSA